MKFKSISYLIGIILLISQSLIAQDSTQNIVFKAMKDELDRSMSKLSYKDFANPFYISYTIEDVSTLFINANLGALSGSTERHYRSWSNRVLAGDYQLNDENFVDATRRKAPRDGDLELPLDNDYFGIRRALWMMTNNTYKSAAENYKNKLAALKDKNLSKQDLQIYDFCKAPRVDTIFAPVKITWDKKNLENLAKSASSIFTKYPEIFYSEVTVFQLHANLYFYSSEQSKFKEPFDILYFTISAIGQAENGENISEQLRYSVISPDDLPNSQVIASDINDLANIILEKSKAPMLDENYSGPVLFLGQPVADVFSSGLFNGTDNLFAYREPLYNNSQMSMYYGQNINSLESKIDKLVISKNITINDFSKLKEFKGIKLLGSYNIDGEGVVPPDTLCLIEKGILKNLYNGRTPTRSIKESNGHRRYIFQSGGITSDLGPGVVYITSNETKSLDKLKEELIKEAKEESLDYAIIVRPSKQGDFSAPVNMYKISVIDGKEQLLRDASMTPLTINSLKKIMAVSNNTMVYNTILSGGGESGPNIFANQESLPTGPPVSFIIPDGVLVKEVEFQHQTKPLATDKPVVKNPILK